MFDRWNLAVAVARSIAETIGCPTDEDLEMIAVEVGCFLPTLERSIPTCRRKLRGPVLGWEDLYNYLKEEANIKDTLRRA